MAIDSLYGYTWRPRVSGRKSTTNPITPNSFSRLSSTVLPCAVRMLFSSGARVSGSADKPFLFPHTSTCMRLRLHRHSGHFRHGHVERTSAASVYLDVRSSPGCLQGVSEIRKPQVFVLCRLLASSASPHIRLVEAQASSQQWQIVPFFLPLPYLPLSMDLF